MFDVFLFGFLVVGGCVGLYFCVELGIYLGKRLGPRDDPDE